MTAGRVFLPTMRKVLASAALAVGSTVLAAVLLARSTHYAPSEGPLAYLLVLPSLLIAYCCRRASIFFDTDALTVLTFAVLQCCYWYVLTCVGLLIGRIFAGWSRGSSANR